MTRNGHNAERVEPVDGVDVTFLASEGANFPPLPSWRCMTAITGVRPGPERTRVLLEQIIGGARGAQLRAKLANANPSATPELIDEAFQVACIRANTACHGQTEGEVYVWLRTTAHREIAHLRASTEHEVPVDTWGSGFDPADPGTPAPVDVLIDREDEAEIRRVTHAILDQLSERQREIVALHSHGRSRREIADHLDLSPRVVKRSIEHILAAGRAELVRLAGRGCEAGEGLVSRVAFGLAGPREMREAQVHLATCASCGALYERLDLWREKVAVLLPLPVPALAGAHTHVVERAMHAGTEVLTQPGGPAGETHRGLRSSLADAVNQLRDHAASVYYRTVDPTPLAGARPGAVAATIAGCIAVGGGTYCAQTGVAPIDVLTGISALARQDDPKAKPKRARAAQAPAPQVVTPTVAAPPTVAPTPAVQQPAPQQAVPTTPVAPPPAPQDEYEPGSAGGTSSASVQAALSTPAKPAPAPAGGPGEFGGP